MINFHLNLCEDRSVSNRIMCVNKELSLIMTPNFRHTLPLEYSASIDHAAGVWTGEARIPGDYFPPDVTLFNAYAIHGTGEGRAYEALYESSGPQADFHRSHKYFGHCTAI